MKKPVSALRCTVSWPLPRVAPCATAARVPTCNTSGTCLPAAEIRRSCAAAISVPDRNAVARRPANARPVAAAIMPRGPSVVCADSASPKRFVAPCSSSPSQTASDSAHGEEPPSTAWVAMPASDNATAVLPSSTQSSPSSRMSEPAGAPNTSRYQRIAILRRAGIRPSPPFWIPDPRTVRA